MNCYAFADGSRFALGPWATLSRLGPASLYDDKAGIKQPGLSANHLYPLALNSGPAAGRPGGMMGGMSRQQQQAQARAGRTGQAGRKGGGAGRGQKGRAGEVEGTSDSGEEGGGTTDGGFVCM